MNVFLEFVARHPIPESLNGLIHSMYESNNLSEHKIMETRLYKMILQHPHFEHRQELLDATLSLLKNKLIDWTSLKDMTHELMMGFIDLLNLEADLPEFLDRHHRDLLSAECSSSMMSDMCGRPGIYLFIIDGYTDPTNSFYDLLKHPELKEDFNAFCIHFLKSKSKLSRFINAPTEELQKADPVLLERLVRYSHKNGLDSFQRIRSLLHGHAKVHNNACLIRPMIEYLHQHYHNHVKIRQYCVYIPDIDELQIAIINKPHPMLSILESDEALDRIARHNRGKVIKILQQERELVMSADCEFDLYDYSQDSVARKYQEVILKVYANYVRLPDMVRQIDQLLDLSGGEMHLKYAISKYNARIRQDLDEGVLPHNRMFSCYINSLLMTQLSNSDTPIFKLLDQPLISSDHTYFPENETDLHIRWMAQGIKHALILLTLKMFYECDPGLSSSDDYVNVLRVFHQFYYLLNVRKTMDVVGNVFENFRCGMHSESVVYDGFLAHIFKRFPQISCSRIHMINYVLNKDGQKIAYNKEFVTNGLTRLNLGFQEPGSAMNIENLLNGQQQESKYAINARGTDYLFILVNQDPDREIDIDVRPSITLNSIGDESLDSLNLTHFPPSEGGQRYELTGIINQNPHHKYCKFLFNGQWYGFDDFPFNRRRLIKIPDISQHMDDVALLMYRKST